MSSLSRADIQAVRGVREEHTPGPEYLLNNTYRQLGLHRAGVRPDRHSIDARLNDSSEGTGYRYGTADG